MTPEELTDEEALTAALLLGFEWTPLSNWEVFAGSPYGQYNAPNGRRLAVSREVAARTYLKHHLPKKP